MKGECEMGNYKCEVCKAINYCPNNISGFGICPKCTPQYTKELNANPLPYGGNEPKKRPYSKSEEIE